MGRKSKKKGDVCVCIADLFCCTVGTDTTLKSNILQQKFKKCTVTRLSLVNIKLQVLAVLSFQPQRAGFAVSLSAKGVKVVTGLHSLLLWVSAREWGGIWAWGFQEAYMTQPNTAWAHWLKTYLRHGLQGSCPWICPRQLHLPTKIIHMEGIQLFQRKILAFLRSHQSQKNLLPAKSVNSEEISLYYSSSSVRNMTVILVELYSKKSNLTFEKGLGQQLVST